MNTLRNRVIIEHIQRRIERNKNAMILAIGDTGSGKSYAGLRLLQKLNKDFSIDNVEFDVKAFLDMVHADHPPGTCMMFDEAGVAMNARDWQSKLNKVMSYVLQTFRFKNYIIVFTVPDLTFVDVHARKLFHYVMQSKHIDYENKISKFSFKRIQTNRNTGLIYMKAIRFNTIEGIKMSPFIKLKLVNEEMVKQYEEKRQQYIKRLYSKLLEDIDGKPKLKKNHKYGHCSLCNYDWQTRIEQPKKCPNCQKKEGIHVTTVRPNTLGFTSTDDTNMSNNSK